MMIRHFLVPFFALAWASAEQIDLVKYGEESFYGLGCAECHSVKKSDDSVKTGPSLYGLFRRGAPKHKVVDPEGHELEVRANRKYFYRSVRTPHDELAIARSGPTNGQPYLPVMPPYDKKILSDFKAGAIYQYLMTLNEGRNAGPAMVMADNRDAMGKMTPEQDSAEMLVTDRARVMRARLAGFSARASFVGLPQGLNYAFDERTMGIETLWWGGFLNLSQELNGRARGMSKYGHGAQPVDIGDYLLRPLHPDTGEMIDLSFISPLHEDWETMDRNLVDPRPVEQRIAEAGVAYLGHREAVEPDEVPTISLLIGENTLSLQLRATADGAEVVIDGDLRQPQTFAVSDIVEGAVDGKITINELPATLKVVFAKPETVWRPKAERVTSVQAVSETELDFLDIAAGYDGVALSAPADQYGRDQLFEPLGMAEAGSAEAGGERPIIVTTRTAGIWKLQDSAWTKVADGTLDAMGVIIEKDDLSSIVIGQRAELTRLIDADGDGYYEVHESLCNSFFHSTNYHEYLHGPTVGADGNYYFQLNLGHYQRPGSFNGQGEAMGTYGPLRGWALSVTPEGEMTRYAYGLRSPAGLATGPDGELYYTDNQGSFFGTSKLFMLKKDHFYGYPASLIDLPNLTPMSEAVKWENVRADRDPPVALIAHSRLGNSPGSPAWDSTGGKFGPTAGDMFIGDQTLSSVFRVRRKSDSEAALIPFANELPSGAMRLLFTHGGDLLVGQTGRGWRARGGNEAALIRLRYDAEKATAQLLDVTRDGGTFTFHFSGALDAVPEEFVLASWGYEDSPKYGSPETNRRTESLDGAVTLADDQRSFSITLADFTEPAESRVYQLRTVDAPHNHHQTMEAFYSIVREK